MKRAEVLQALSREHNRALLLARTARRAAASGDAAVVHASWCELEAAWHDEMAAHFAAEERGVIPLLSELGEDALAARLLREHRAIRRTITERERWSAARLAALADVLRDHVRCEERRAFPLVEAGVGPDRLAGLLADHADD